MLSCQEVARRASALIDQDLTPWQAFRMRLHLAMCKGCRNFVAQMRVTKELTEGAQESKLSTGDAAKIDVILSQADQPPRTGK